MSGLRVFQTLRAAIDAGYQVFDTVPEGYLVRIRTSSGWAMALVEIREGE